MGCWGVHRNTDLLFKEMSDNQQDKGVRDGHVQVGGLREGDSVMVLEV